MNIELTREFQEFQLRECAISVASNGTSSDNVLVISNRFYDFLKTNLDRPYMGSLEIECRVRMMSLRIAAHKPKHKTDVSVVRQAQENYDFIVANRIEL